MAAVPVVLSAAQLLQISAAAAPNAIAQYDANGNLIGVGVEGKSFLSSLGSLFLNSKPVTTNTTLDLTMTVVKANCAGGAITLTLPAISASANQLYLVIKTDSTTNVPTIQGAGADDIATTSSAGANTYASLTHQGMAALIFCDGDNNLWWAMKLT